MASDSASMLLWIFVLCALGIFAQSTHLWRLFCAYLAFATVRVVDAHELEARHPLVLLGAQFETSLNKLPSPYTTRSLVAARVASTLVFDSVRSVLI